MRDAIRRYPVTNGRLPLHVLAGNCIEFFLDCKANARVILAKTGHGPHSSKIVVLFYVLFVLYCFMYCLCVNVYCHRVTTQLQLTNISYILSVVLERQVKLVKNMAWSFRVITPNLPPNHAPSVFLVLPLAGWWDNSRKISHDLLSVPSLL